MKINDVEKSIENAKKLNSKSATRLIKNTKRAAQKVRLRLPSQIKRQLCKKCNTVLIPSKNCTTRSNTKTISYTCHNCKHISRIGYKS